jgi:hypothetical protein
MEGNLFEGKVQGYHADVYPVTSDLGYMLCTVKHKRKKYSEDNPERKQVCVRNVMDSDRFSEDKAMDYDIPEQERRIKDRNQEKITAQILHLPIN